MVNEGLVWHENRARLAFTALFSVAGGLILVKTGQDIQQSVLWWLVYVVLCGVSLNTQQGVPVRILLAGAVVAASAMIAVTIFMGIIRPQGALISMATPEDAVYWKLTSFVWAVSIAGIVVACYAREVVLSLLRQLGRKEETVLRWEKILNSVVKIGGSIGVIAKVLI